MSATADQALAPASTGAAARKELPDQMPLQERGFQISREEFRLVKSDDGHYRLSFPVSSETPIPRWYGEEVLSHDASAIRVDRLNRGAVMHLFNHNGDEPRGVVEGYRIQAKKLWVDVKFFKTAKAEELATMIDGGYRNVSLLYAIHVTEEDVKKHRYTHTEWEPFEVSSVSMPADASVGVGRDQDSSSAIAKRSAEYGQFAIRKVRIERIEPPDEVPSTPAKPADSTRSNAMADQANAPAGNIADPTNTQTPATPQISGGGNAAAEMEKSRINAIGYFARANAVDKTISDHWIQTGKSLEEVGKELVDIQAQRNAAAKPPSHLDLSRQDVRRFSIRNAICAVADKNWTKAGFEADCSREIAQKMGFQTDPNKFYVPLDIQQRQHRTPVEELAYALMKRDLTVATAGAGGYLVETANIGFVELLRNRSVCFQMGALRMPGMVGNLTIPKQSAAGTAFWLSTEATGITESQQTFVQIALSPKTVGGYTEISRLLLLQSSPAADGLVMSDLAAIVALAADAAILNGSGAAGQPTGITATSGIGAVTGTSLAYDDIIEFQTDTATANALLAGAGYVTTPTVAGLLKQRVKFTNTGTPLWDGQLLDAIVDGYRAMASNQVTAASMLFGAFGTVIVPEWGVLELEVNPYANFAAGIVGVRAMYTMDVGVRYPTAFSQATAIT